MIHIHAYSTEKPKERSQKDVETFKSLVKEEFKSKISDGKTFQAGKIQPEKPRPLIVTLHDGGKWDILRLAHSLEDTRCLAMCSHLQTVPLTKENETEIACGGKETKRRRLDSMQSEG